MLIRGATAYAIAVRAPDKSIRLEARSLGRLARNRWSRLPLLRGLISLRDSLVLGTRALLFSAEVQSGEGGPSGTAMDLTMFGAMVAGVAFFFGFPALAASLVENGLGLDHPWGQWLEGGIRLAMLAAYLGLVGLVPEIRRVYGYHGAEHMAIHALEAGAPLDPPSVARFPPEHARCGTSFLLTLVVLSILIFTALGPLPLGTRIVSRIVLIPALAALAYEYIRLLARVADRWWGRLLLAPNLALQRLTTRKPEPAMIEVALAALDAVRRAETA